MQVPRSCGFLFVGMDIVQYVVTGKPENFSNFIGWPYLRDVTVGGSMEDETVP